MGIEEVYINLHYLPEQICAYAGDGAAWGLKVEYNYEPELAGTGGAVRGFASRLEGEPFLVIYGDNFCIFPLEEIVDAHFGEAIPPDMSIVLFEKDDVSHSGVAVCEPDGRIKSFVEKPAPGTTDSHWVNAGVYLLSPVLLATIPEGTSDFGKELIPAYLAKGLRLLGVKTAGRVLAVDTPEMLARTQAGLDRG
jgi:mannose-1-phosphate guanylyltransferase/mannose-1-phosphate guanylyltransferase/phosphomannomutase